MSILYKVHLVIIKTLYPYRESIDLHAYHLGGTFNGSFDLWSGDKVTELAMNVQAFAEYYNLAILTEQIVTVDLRNKE